MTGKLLWEIAASLQIVIAIAHLFGTLYSELLYPKDKNLIEQMKNTLLNVDNKATQWNAWIFFNLAFASCLFIVGVFSFVLAYQNFDIINGLTVLSATMIGCSLLIVFFANRLAIRKVRTAFLITTVLYLVSISLG